jgi:hypothetical protein
MAGLDAGLFRIGWALPLPQEELPLAHGPLMVVGFLGTLIGLEKAVALGSRFALLGPLATGLGGLGLVVRSGATAPRLFFVLGSLGVAVVVAIFFFRQRTLANGCIVAGAVVWAASNALWLAGWPLFAVVPGWVGFLLLTIAGERLELNRLRRPTPLRRGVFVAAAAAVVAAIGLAAFGFSRGGQVLFLPDGARFSSALYDGCVRSLGASLVVIGLWLLSTDIARVALKRPGLSRFMALSLLLGYGWLLVGGATWLLRGAVVSGPPYDAALHAFFLGFVFSMIFAHGPVIFPAILERSVDFHPAFYLHLALLHVGLLLRVGGDVGDVPQARAWGGLVNAIAILVFLAATATSAARGRSLRPAA